MFSKPCFANWVFRLSHPRIHDGQTIHTFQTVFTRPKRLPNCQGYLKRSSPDSIFNQIPAIGGVVCVFAVKKLNF